MNEICKKCRQVMVLGQHRCSYIDPRKKLILADEYYGIPGMYYLDNNWQIQDARAVHPPRCGMIRKAVDKVVDRLSLIVDYITLQKL